MVIIVLGLGVVIPRWGGKRPLTWAQSDASGSPNEPLRDFWSDFLRGENLAIVAFSDATFLATQTADLLRLKKGEEVGELGTAEDDKVARRRLANPSLLEHSGPLVFNDAYTGTGEVMGVYFLTRVFEELHFPLVVKRSRLLTIDDLKRHNLIFLGSIMENPMESVPLKQDFVFVQTSTAGPFQGQIRNLHPLPGEPASFEIGRDANDQAVTTDYALVSFLPGRTPSRKVAVLGGLTTFGTQAAADFVTSPAQISKLATALGIEQKPSSGQSLPPYFQAVLQVDIVRGDILNIRYVVGRVITP